jgi:valyl-tRNA synthetase
VKPRLYDTEPGGDVARAVLARIFEVALQVLHPIMPFITEALWKRFPGRGQDESIMLSAWPAESALARQYGLHAERRFSLVQEVIEKIRVLRAEYGIEPGKLVSVKISHLSPDSQTACTAEMGTIRRLGKASEVSLGEAKGEVGAYATISDGTTVFVELRGVLDLPRECARLMSEWERLQKLIDGQDRKLNNENFLAQAPADVVERERKKRRDLAEQRKALAQKRETLGCV